MKKSTKKAKVKPPKVQQPDTAVLTNVQEQLYLIEIKDLKEKLNRAQNLAEELQKLSDEYIEKYEEEVRTKEAISSYMKRCIEEFAAETNDLNKKVIGLQNQYETEKKQLEEKLENFQAENQQTIKNLQEENLTLSGKLATLEEFERQKDSLYKKLETLETKYCEEAQQHEEKLALLQQELIMEHNRLKKQYEAKQGETKDFHISDERATYFVTTAISEMKKLKHQLQESRKQVLKFSEENDKLKSDKLMLNEKLLALESTENGLVTKIGTQKKVIATLQKQRKVQADLMEEMKNVKKAYDQLQEVAKEYKVQVDDKENTIASMTDDNIRLNEQVEFIKEKAKRQDDMNIQLIIIILRAAKVIKEGIMTSSNKAEHMSHQREAVLHQLMMILDTSSQFYSDYYFKCLADHGIPCHQIESWFEDETTVVKYQPGDLGFIPKYEKKLLAKQKEFQFDEISDQKVEQASLELKDREILSSAGLLTSYEKLAQRLQKL